MYLNIVNSIFWGQNGIWDEFSGLFWHLEPLRSTAKIQGIIIGRAANGGKVNSNLMPTARVNTQCQQTHSIAVYTVALKHGKYPPWN